MTNTVPRPAFHFRSRHVFGAALCAAVAAGTAIAAARAAGQDAGAAEAGKSAEMAAVAPAKPKSTPRAKASAQPKEPAVEAAGCGSPGAIGLSREFPIDTAEGPRFGHQQFHDIDFLQDGEVVLTFDDGPLRPYTMPVLKALEAHCTKATFFVVGRMAISDPALVKETEKRGHTVGTHTWSHMDVRKTNTTRGRGEIELGISAVSKALGHPVAPFFRFPYLSSPKGMLDYVRSRKIGVFSIEVDAIDYRTKDPAVVHRNVLSQLQTHKKGIILFHDIQPSTAHALMSLLGELKARGFKVVHLVATSHTTTLPEYDAIAEKELARKSQIANSDPLAARSIVWPVATGDAAQDAAAGKDGKRVAKAGADPDEVLPWGIKASKQDAVTASKPAAKPAKAGQDADLDWVGKLFKF